MDRTTNEELQAILAVGSRTYVRNLSAAERAVLSGQFNAAKVLRALAYTHRVMATNAARLLESDAGVATVLADNAEALGREKTAEVQDGWAGETQRDDAMQLKRFDLVRAQADKLLGKARESLARNGEVFDDDIGEILWSCAGCGYVTDGRRPERCPICGGIAAEFEDFGPFYIDTPEHLGHRAPPEILEIMSKTPSRFARLVRGVSRGVLARKPSQKEWSTLEILGHLVEIEELFITRVRPILESEEIPTLSVPVPAWKLHVGKGYEAADVDELMARFTRVRENSVQFLASLASAQWSRQGRMPWKNVTVADLGTWVANHDLGHLAQIRRRIRDRG